MLRVLDLFSGIGGFSIGLEKTGGFETVAFCEIEAFQRRVLERHWPGVPIFHDVRELSSQHLTAAGVVVDVICGGFPCQDISVAGKGAGLEGARSGLWREFARLIGELRPAYVIVENVSALLARGLGDILGDLAALGYDAEWHCIPASAIGAPHRRDRVWIVAYASGAERRWVEPEWRQDRRDADVGGHGAQGLAALADADGGGRREQGHVESEARRQVAGQPRDGGAVLANADRQRCERLSSAEFKARACAGSERGSSAMGLASFSRLPIGPGSLAERAHAATTGTGWWAAEPDVGRVVDGPADKVDRRKRLIALGNAVVPQIPEILGRAILARSSA